MAALPKQVIPVRFTGLDGKSDPKTAPVGRLTQADNVFARRRTEGGIEFEKAYGFTSLSRNIFGGGTISSGRKVSTYKDELVITDGQWLYSWSALLDSWVKRGKAQGVGARIELLDGNAGLSEVDVDVAAFGGFLLFVTDDNVLGSNSRVNYYVQEKTSGTVIARGTFGGFRPRLAVVGTKAFLFYIDTSAPYRLLCVSIDASTPGTLSAPATVATDNFATSAGVFFPDRFDVTVDSANARMIVAYRNTTPRLALVIWNTNMTAGARVAHAARDNGYCVGFLLHQWNNGLGYVAIGDSAAGDVRCLTFSTTTMVTSVDALVEAAALPAGVTGAFSGTARHVFYSVSYATLGGGSGNKIRGWDSVINYDFQGDVQLASKCFKIGSLYYVCAQTQQTDQRHNYLLEFTGTAAATGDSGVSVAGLLLSGNGARNSPDILGSVAALAADQVVFGIASFQGNTLLGTTKLAYYGIAKISLTWNESTLGDPVEYADVLHLPAAAGKVYDRNAVYENGFYRWPTAPRLLAAVTGGAGMTLGTYKYLAVFSRIDGGEGRIQRSVGGVIASLTLTGAQNSASVSLDYLRLTDSDPRHNINQSLRDILLDKSQVRIELYRTKVNESNFYLHSSNYNDATLESFTVTDTMSDATLAANELFYGSKEAENTFPAAPLVYQTSRTRMWALAGDNSVWHTKELVGGIGASFCDEMRIEVDSGEGDFTGLVGLESWAALFQESGVSLFSGDGPDLFGNSPYAPPTKLPGRVGMAQARQFAVIPDGALVKSEKGFVLVSRAGDVQPVEGGEAYDALTVSGGVALQDRPFAVFVTSDGGLLIYDHQLKQWYTRSGHTAVACSLWQNKLVILLSNGTVRVESPGQYNDDGNPYTCTLELAWLGLSNARLYKSLVTGDALATCTLSATMSRDLDATTETAPKTIALTTASKPPWVFVPDWARLHSLRMKLTETSATQGVRLSAIGLEVGIKPGAAKFNSSSYMG